MRFSRPRMMSRLRSPMSASITTTRLPSLANPMPRLAVAVVFPTPPLPEAITKAFPVIGRLPPLHFPGEGFDHNPVALHPADLRARRSPAPLVLFRPRDERPNAQLQRDGPERYDDRIGMVRVSGVLDAPQRTEHDNVARGQDLRPLVYVAHDHHVPVRDLLLARAQVSPQVQGRPLAAVTLLGPSAACGRFGGLLPHGDPLLVQHV